jgi:hypothetical protein
MAYVPKLWCAGTDHHFRLKRVGLRRGSVIRSAIIVQQTSGAGRYLDWSARMLCTGYLADGTPALCSAWETSAVPRLSGNAFSRSGGFLPAV